MFPKRSKGDATRAGLEFPGARAKQKIGVLYVDMNHGTLLGIREKKHINDAIATVTHDFSQEMLRWKCMFQVFRRFKGTLQLLYIDVAKVDQRCRIYCKCFRGMLQLFHMDIAKEDQGYCTYCKCSRHVASVSEVLFKIFYLFQTYVASVLI
jgi:hypothetical protein